jgi:hypothetical protein
LKFYFFPASGDASDRPSLSVQVRIDFSLEQPEERTLADVLATFCIEKGIGDTGLTKLLKMIHRDRPKYDLATLPHDGRTITKVRNNCQLCIVFGWMVVITIMYPEFQTTTDTVLSEVSWPG